MIKNPSTNSTDWNIDLLKIWLTRYLPSLGPQSVNVPKQFEEQVAVAASAEARQITRLKLLNNLDAHCTMSGVHAQQLLLEEWISLRFLEARKLSVQLEAIYTYLIDAYAEDFLFSPIVSSLHQLNLDKGKQAAAIAILPGFNRLLQGLEPMLDELQSTVLSFYDQKAIGFLTTQMCLSRERVLRGVDCYERIWLLPYLRLTEEFLCIPWQRLCAAANRHLSDSPTVAVVTKMLPKANSISLEVYQRALRVFPNHISRQGRIQSSAVYASSVRDLSMFQAYIWLALLEGNLSVIKQELLPLCALVFPRSKVKWDFIVKGIQWLSGEICMHLTPAERVICSGYLGLIEAMFKQANPEHMDITELKGILTSQVSRDVNDSAKLQAQRTMAMRPGHAANDIKKVAGFYN